MKEWHRRSIRLRGYDYTRKGVYFVTICTQDRACLFGEIVNDEMRLSEAGAMVAEIWAAMPQRFPCVTNRRIYRDAQPYPYGVGPGSTPCTRPRRQRHASRQSRRALMAR